MKQKMKFFASLSLTALLTLVLAFFMFSCTTSSGGGDGDGGGDGTGGGSDAPTIVITTPTASGGYSTADSSVDLAGFASDDISVSKVTWKNDKGGSGTASGVDEWTATGVSLKSGDNEITVTAQDGDGNKATDTITVTYNSNLDFLSALQATPDSIFVNESTSVTFRVAIENNPNLDKSSVKLLEVDSNNNIVRTVATLADDGNVSNGDDIASDGVFSGIATLSESAEGSIRLRVSADTTNGSTQTAYNEVSELSVITHITTEEFNTALSMPDDAQAKYDDLSKSNSEDEAKAKTVEWLQSLSEVVQAGVSESGNGIWYVLDSGLLGGIILNPEGTRGSVRNGASPVAPDTASAPIILRANKGGAGANEPTIGNNKALIIGPFHTAFGATSEGGSLELLFQTADCPFDVTTIYDANANVAAFKTLSGYGIVSIISHGDTFFDAFTTAFNAMIGWNLLGPQVIILTGEKATAGNKAANEADLKKGRLIITGGGYYAITPSFISQHNGSFPSTVVHAGSCRSLYNGSMASAFIGNGAKTYTGYTAYVLSSYAKNTVIDYWMTLVDDKTTQEAFNDTVAANGASDGQAVDPAFFRMQGATDMKITKEGLINGGFEKGNINGWTGAGDVRVITQLGPLTPQEGNYMNIISTGLGSVNSSDSVIEQSFCISSVDNDATTLSFNYNVISEEPMEWVGSQFDDQFEATLITSTGSTQLAYESINSSSWTAVSGINFAGGDSTTFMTGWKTVTYNISGLPKDEAVTIKFRTWDKGDSIYDTAALIDNVELK